MLKLIGILIVVLGLAAKQNPVGTVFVAAVVTGLVGGIPLDKLLTTIGQNFVANRTMLVFLLTLPAVGVLEKHGLKEYAAKLIRRIKTATAGRVIAVYLFFRWVSSALGLRLGGHPVFVRPLVAPMAEGAVGLDPSEQEQKDHVFQRVRALSAAAENYGNFFGQNIFVAAAGLLLIQSTMQTAGYPVDLGTMALYSVPAGIACVVLGFVQFLRFDKWAEREVRQEKRGTEK